MQKRTRRESELTLDLGGQHVSGVVQVPVVDLRSYPQDVTHQWVDVDGLEGPDLQVLLEGRSHSPEEGLHVHLLVVEAVLSVVELHWEVLEG